MVLPLDDAVATPIGVQSSGDDPKPDCGLADCLDSVKALAWRWKQAGEDGMARIDYAVSQDSDEPNVTRMLANASGPVFEAMTRLLTSLMTQSSLDPRLRELAILRVGYISNASYELFQHEPFARYAGLSTEQIAAIKQGDFNSPALDEAQTAVLQFVDDVVANVRASNWTLAAVAGFLEPDPAYRSDPGHWPIHGGLPVSGNDRSRSRRAGSRLGRVHF